MLSPPVDQKSIDCGATGGEDEPSRMRLRAATAVVATIVAAASCTRPDELICQPPEEKYYCQMECLVRPCNSLFYEPRKVQSELCGEDAMDALLKFVAVVRAYDVRDCTGLDCRAADPPPLPAQASAGSTYHEQGGEGAGETESAAAGSGGWWEPLPGGSGCIP
jgi:hypothetical protein